MVHKAGKRTDKSWGYLAAGRAERLEGPGPSEAGRKVEEQVRGCEIPTLPLFVFPVLHCTCQILPGAGVPAWLSPNFPSPFLLHTLNFSFLSFESPK